MNAQDHIVENEKPTEMNTLTSCVNKATKEGYVESFKVEDHKLVSTSGGKRYAPKDIDIKNFYRFEGESDPAENAILYVIETKDGVKGMLINAYGVYADEDINKFIKKVEDIHKKTEISGHKEKNHNEDKSYYFAKLNVDPIRSDYKSGEKLKGKVAIITGGDSGIGRSVAVHYAREGANVAIVFLKSTDDAQATKAMVEKEGAECILFEGDISNEMFCEQIANETYDRFGRIDVLVNNAGLHKEDETIEGISKAQLKRTFEVNIFSVFYLCTYALKYMKEGGAIINTTSVTAYRGSEHLIDYASSKGAIVSFTRSMAQNLAEKKIRVNAVAPGPVWTPLVVNSFDAKHLGKFGKDTPLGRAGYPHEIAPAFVYLASDDSSYTTGEVIHINGGEIVNT